MYAIRSYYAAFQFVGDIMGGYDTPYQQLSWLLLGGGKA